VLRAQRINRCESEGSGPVKTTMTLRRITRILLSLWHGHLGRGLHGRDARATSRDIKGKATG
jgi:hypothetical protein